MKDEYKDCFNGAKKIYWLPSYLAREDPKQTILSPSELIEKLSDPTIASPMKQDDHLLETIYQHLDNGDMVVCMNGGGGGGLDEWLRENFS
jgi:UDP-N-acetylmuramate-alanine ligase